DNSRPYLRTGRWKNVRLGPIAALTETGSAPGWQFAETFRGILVPATFRREHERTPLKQVLLQPWSMAAIKRPGLARLDACADGVRLFDGWRASPVRPRQNPLHQCAAGERFPALLRK